MTRAGIVSTQALATNRTDEEGQASAQLADAYSEHASYVARLAYRLLGRRDEVEDLVQDVFVIAAEKRWQLREATSLRAWLASIAVNRAKNRLRVRKMRRFLSLDSGQEDAGVPSAVLPTANERPDDTVENHTLLRRVWRELDRIPTDERLAWSLRQLEELSLDECADLCNCSLSTVKRRIAAAQSALSAALGEDWGTQ